MALEALRPKQIVWIGAEHPRDHSHPGLSTAGLCNSYAGSVGVWAISGENADGHTTKRPAWAEIDEDVLGALPQYAIYHLQVAFQLHHHDCAPPTHCHFTTAIHVDKDSGHTPGHDDITYSPPSHSARCLLSISLLCSRSNRVNSTNHVLQYGDGLVISLSGSTMIMSSWEYSEGLGLVTPASACCHPEECIDLRNEHLVTAVWDQFCKECWTVSRVWKDMRCGTIYESSHRCKMETLVVEEMAVYLEASWNEQA